MAWPLTLCRDLLSSLKASAAHHLHMHEQVKGAVKSRHNTAFSQLAIGKK